MRKLSTKLTVAAFVAALCAATSSATADIIVSPVSVTSSMGTFRSDTQAGHLISQAGLSHGFATGDNAENYFNSNPTHASTPKWQSQTGTTTGHLDFDLGSKHSLSQFALWNYGGGFSLNIRDFNLLGDTDGDFSSGAISLLSNETADRGAVGSFSEVPAQLFSFSQTEVQFVRLEILSNYGHTHTGAAEVAFAAVPEPASASLLGVALSGVVLQRRRRRSS